MKLPFIFVTILFLSCGQENKRVEKEQKAKDSVSTHLIESLENLNEDEWEAPAEVQEKSPLRISILNLYKSMEDKDEQEFLRQFPKDFEQFQNYFGWDATNNAPHELYEHSVHYIEYLFYLLRTNKYPAYEKNLISLCENGQWEADAVNYFQDHVVNYIKENEKYHLINALSDDRAKSVLFFLFDGPHPKFDADFASYLSPSKKVILEELFETGFDDDNENPDPFPDEEISIKYTLSDYVENEHFFIRDIDINNDGILDKIVSAGPYLEDELLLFINDGEAYRFALKTSNFSEDGGNLIVDVIAEKGGFLIKTAFPDGGLLEAYHHIAFTDKHWILNHTIYKTQSSNQEDAFIYVCDVEQNLDLADADVLNKLKWLPDEVERDRVCTKEML
ncbi:hypothetical protein [Pareuzebyella sediminis]|uniref:hypothetical protein n=1 Tax=Pareuzebyella sediminis TaxID=2607998 RepID=UPI0011F08365|nr:hypothetical protein [Pareuzebyella sediminis]